MGNLNRLFVLIILTLSITDCSSFSGRTYSVTETDYRSNDGTTNFQVHVAKYSGSVPSQKSLLILPPTGGENFIDRSYARDFSSEGYDVFILQSWTGIDERSTDLEIHERFYGGGQKAIETVLNHITSPYIGLLGTSVGALHAAVAASKQPRINSVFIITGGAPIATVVTTSDQEAMLELRKNRSERYGFKTAEENAAAIEKKFSFEPMTLGDGFKTKDLGMVIAENDKTVPTATQENLRNYWKPKKVIYYSNNHFFGIIRTWLMNENDVLNFFESSAKH